MTVDDGAQAYPVRAGETLLDAGLRAGLDLPYECRNGGCGLCLCTVQHGSVDHGPFQESALPASLRAQGQTLMCCATPRSDLAIDVVRADGPRRAPLHTYEGRVETLERLSPELIRLTVSLPEGQHIRFSAGQYINIILEDGQRRAYSFANAPDEGTRIELHVGLVPGSVCLDIHFVGDVESRLLVLHRPRGAVREVPLA